MKIVLKEKDLGLLSKFLQESDGMICDLNKIFASTRFSSQSVDFDLC